jgi:hypothetical protein
MQQPNLLMENYSQRAVVFCLLSQLQLTFMKQEEQLMKLLVESALKVHTTEQILL